MSSMKDIKLFTTQAHPCSYLPGRSARTLFIDPEYEVSPEMHTRLSEMGFRRSGPHMYRPHCEGCQKCIPCRILVDSFRPNKRFRRILKKNADLRVERVDDIEGEEFFRLYAHYVNTRHRDGDMYPASREQYESFLVEGCSTTLWYAMRDQEDELLGLIVTDRLDNALSAVYTFYSPEASKRSLGNFAILWQIEEARRLALPYVYLGYWIKDCEKMNYKTQYRPVELLINGRWVQLN